MRRIIIGALVETVKYYKTRFTEIRALFYIIRVQVYITRIIVGVVTCTIIRVLVFYNIVLK